MAMLRFSQATEVRGIEVSPRSLTNLISWTSGVVLPTGYVPVWVPRMTYKAARERLKEINKMHAGTKGFILVRWRYAKKGSVEVMLVLFRRALPDWLKEPPPDWFHPRPDVYERLRGKDLV